MRGLIIIGSTLVLAASGFFLFRGAVVSSREPDSPADRAKESALTFRETDFGRVWIQPAFVHRVLLVNSGDIPLTIDEVTGSCSCTVAHSVANTLPARGQVQVDLTIDLRKGAKDGRFQSDITVHLKAPDGTALFASTPIVGNVEPCPVQVVWDRPLPLLAIKGVPDTWRGSARLIAPSDTGVRAEADGQIVSAVHLHDATPVHESAIEYSLSQELPQGIHEGTIRLTVTQGGAVPRTLDFPTRIQVVPDAVAIPSSVKSAARRFGETVIEFVTIRSRSGKAVSDVVVQESPEYVSARIEQGPDSLSRVVRVESIVPSQGRSTNVLRLVVTLQDSAVASHSLEIPVLLTGHSSAPPYGQGER